MWFGLINGISTVVGYLKPYFKNYSSDTINWGEY